MPSEKRHEIYGSVRASLSELPCGYNHLVVFRASRSSEQSGPGARRTNWRTL